MTPNVEYNRNPFTSSFTFMKIRYSEYDKSIDGKGFINPNDKINVFISFESVLNGLSMVRDIENKMLLDRQFPVILESEMINLCAHYKRFFRDNGLDTKIYMYYTDLASNDYENFKYNDEYRSFYMNKYLNNPKFQMLGRSLIERIIPRVQKIMEFIPDVYFIKATNIEGSLIPYIIHKFDTSRKNFVVSSDKYDTHYMMYPNDFCMHYIKRSTMGTAIIHEYNKFIVDLFKDNMDETEDGDLFKNPSFFAALYATLGDKPRSIEPIKKIGCKSVVKMLNSAIENGKMTKDCTSYEMIETAFPEETREFLKPNFMCSSIESQYSNLSQDKLFEIQNQIVDRFDYNSLLTLNSQDYLDHPLMLPELTK